MVGGADLADVVQRAGAIEQFDLLFVLTHVAAHERSDLADALHVSARVVVLGIDGFDQRLHGLRRVLFLRLDAHRESVRGVRVAAQAPALLQSLDGERHLVEGEGLGEVVVRAAAQRIDRDLLARLTRHDDDVGRLRITRRRDALDLAEEFQTGEARHLDVGDHEEEAAVVQELESPLGIGSRGDLEAEAAQEHGEQTANARLVVHDQDAALPAGPQVQPVGLRFHDHGCFGAH